MEETSEEKKIENISKKKYIRVCHISFDIFNNKYIFINAKPTKSNIKG